MDLTMVRDRVAGDPRADELMRLIAAAERIAADRGALGSVRAARRRVWLTGGTAAVLVAGGVSAVLASRDNDGKSPTVPPPPTLGPTRTIPTTPAATTTLPISTSSVLANAPVGTAPATSVPG